MRAARAAAPGLQQRAVLARASGRCARLVPRCASPRPQLVPAHALVTNARPATHLLARTVSLLRPAPREAAAPLLCEHPARMEAAIVKLPLAGVAWGLPVRCEAAPV